VLVLIPVLLEIFVLPVLVVLLVLPVLLYMATCHNLHDVALARGGSGLRIGSRSWNAALCCAFFGAPACIAISLDVLVMRIDLD
jgi:hypothetical protein